jgi:mannosylglucosylglycerate synthase
MADQKKTVGILHYTAPPVVGGVENVIRAHMRLLVEAGYPTIVIAGRGSQDGLIPGARLMLIPGLDSEDPQILKINRRLEAGEVPEDFAPMVDNLIRKLADELASIDVLMVHNIFTKHFNLPLTAAIFRLLDERKITRCLAWCHDITWTSPHSHSKVFPGYPWDLLRTSRPDVTYVAVSQARQQELSTLFGSSAERIQVIYNGVDAQELLALSGAGLALIRRLGLLARDLNLIVPVRIPQAKNIEFAIQVAANLKSRGVDVKVVVTGPPDPHDPESTGYYRELIALRHRLKVDQEVKFVYESGPDSLEPYVIGMAAVAELLRVCDALLMPSHREGFGIPILEAGLIGMPIFCMQSIPSVQEIATHDANIFSPETSPDMAAELIFCTLKQRPTSRLKRLARKEYIWENIFRQTIEPLLDRSAL